MLLSHSNLFSPIDLKLRIFARAPRTSATARIPAPNPPAPRPSRVPEKARLAQSAFEILPFAQAVVDASGKLALFNARAAAMFALAPRDIGRSFYDLDFGLRPLELRPSIEQARNDRRAVHLRNVERNLPSGGKMHLDIQINPLFGEGATGSVSIVFNDVTQLHQMEHDLGVANVDLDAAHEELKSTSEELETTNEELQSTVEELETTNEELQSTNEELETMNEELQSTNEELQTMNEELRVRGGELKKLNAFFGGIVSSLTTGVVVLDEELLVDAWNPKMEDLWGLRAEEVQKKHFLNLDIGVPLDLLAAPLRACVATNKEASSQIDCTNRRGRPIRCRVSAMPLLGHVERGVILLFEEISDRSQPSRKEREDDGPKEELKREGD